MDIARGPELDYPTTTAVKTTMKQAAFANPEMVHLRKT